PFFTTKPVGKGTGLGLSMIYGFVQQSGGAVRLISELGRGTSVSMYFPRSRTRERDRQVAPPSAPPTASAERELILVVEDDPVVRTLAEHMLASLGYRTLLAKDASAGVCLLEHHRNIDLVLSD